MQEMQANTPKMLPDTPVYRAGANESRGNPALIPLNAWDNSPDVR